MEREQRPCRADTPVRCLCLCLLVQRPEQWKWSSFRAYLCGEPGPVRVNFQEWALEIKSRPVRSFAEVKSPLIRKERE